MSGEVVFDESIVRNHRWAGKYLSDLDQLCRNEKNYGNKDYFHRLILCLDMDAIERDQTGLNDCTMDAAVGIAICNDGRLRNPQFALVELRLAHKSVRNFDFDNMERKASHTRDLLITDSVVYPVYFFVYPENIYSRAIYRFSQESRTRGKKWSWKAVSPTTFLNHIKFNDSLSYKPETDIENLKQVFFDSFFPNPINAIDVFCRWTVKVYEYYTKNKTDEGDAILNALKKTVDNIAYGDNNELKMAVELIQKDAIWNLCKKKYGNDKDNGDHCQ